MVKTLEDMQAEFASRNIPQITREEIKEYNDKPEVKDRGAKIVTISSDRFKNILLVLLAILVLSGATFAYLAYNDKLKLMNIDIPACPAQAEIPACPAAPACAACPTVNVNCGNSSFICPSMSNLTVRMVNSS